MKRIHYIFLSGLLLFATLALTQSISPVSALTCSNRSLNIVAHEDDDLLFMNPAINDDIQAGKCVQTIFMTAGDGGVDQTYWLSRESGMKAAYAQMAGENNTWTNSSPSIYGHTVQMFTLAANPNISLIFMRLPDGGGTGNTEGYASNNYQTMKKLWQQSISTINTVDNSTTYSREDLIDTLAVAMATYGPETIRTLNHIDSYSGNDHSDHSSAAYFANAAKASRIVQPHQFIGYEGYTIENKSANVSGNSLVSKQNAFYTYNVYDGSDCTSTSNCSPLLSNWLERSYTVSSSSVSTNAAYETMEGDAGSLSQLNADVGAQPAAVVFGSDSYVFYADKSSGYLRFAKTPSNSNSWTFTTLDGAGGANGRISASVGGTPSAVVYNGQIHVFYYDATHGNLRHAWSSDGSSWSMNNHDGDLGSIGGLNANVGLTPTAVVYGTSLQLFYYDATAADLRHSWTGGTNWSFETLDGSTGSISGRDASVGTDPTAVVYDGTLQLFYHDATTQDLRHTWADNSGWHFEGLDGSGGLNGRNIASTGYSPTALVDSGNGLHVFYYDATYGNLRHIWCTPTTGWQAENLAGDSGAIIREEGNIGLMPYAALSGNEINVLSYDGTKGNLTRIWHNGTAWQKELVDGFGINASGSQDTNLGYDPVAISYNSKLHMFYYDLVGGNLRHSWR